MPLSLPNLDDRRYADLVEEAIALLPRYAPGWTNHNPSDPGITLIEVLAFFAETLIFRLNRVTRENKIAFIRLLRGADWSGGEALADASMETVDEALRKAVFDLREPQRAVTAEDFEYLARRATVGNPEEARVLRARCVVRRDLRGDVTAREVDRPGHVSVVIVPGAGLDAKASEGLFAKVQDSLNRVRLLTTRLHVVKPFYASVSLGAVIHLRHGAVASEVRRDAVEALRRYFDPLPRRGPEGKGWPFGGNLYLSDVYDVLEGVAGVDYVKNPRVLEFTVESEPGVRAKAAVGIQIGIRSKVGVDSRLGVEPGAGADRVIRNRRGKLVGVALRPYELIQIELQEENLRIVEAAFAVEST